MADPFAHVQRGDRFPSDVITVNGWMDAARFVSRNRAGHFGGSSARYSSRPHSTTFILNQAGLDLPAFSVVKLVDTYIDPALEPSSILEQPLFRATIPDDADNLIGILLEPISSNSAGLAVLLGVAVVPDIIVNDSQHLCCRPIPGRIDALETCRVGPARLLHPGTGSLSGSEGSIGSGTGSARGVVILTQDLPWDALGSGSGSGPGPSLAEQILARLCVVREGGSGISGTGSASGQQGNIIDIKYLDDDGNCIELPDCTPEFCGPHTGSGDSGTGDELPACGGAVVICDWFDGADSSTLNGRTPDCGSTCGGTWSAGAYGPPPGFTPRAYTAEIQSNLLSVTGNGYGAIAASPVSFTGIISFDVVSFTPSSGTSGGWEESFLGCTSNSSTGTGGSRYAMIGMIVYNNSTNEWRLRIYSVIGSAYSMLAESSVVSGTPPVGKRLTFDAGHTTANNFVVTYDTESLTYVGSLPFGLVGYSDFGVMCFFNTAASTASGGATLDNFTVET